MNNNNSRMNRYHNNNNNNVKKGNHTKKKLKKKRIIVLSILLIFFFLIGAGGFYVINTLGKLKTTKISKSNEDLGISEELVKKLDESGKDDKILNIALFGTDERSDKERGRSDAIMILTVDKEHNKLKISSIMRDSYVNIDGHGKDKLNHAYAFGGPQLAIKTLNQNYNMNIKDYASVNFYHLQDIIDAVGGIEVDIKKNEIGPVNSMMTELAQMGKYDPPFLKGAGVQTLNGKQALAYARTRHVGNGDFDRTERQRTVITALFDKIKSAGITKYPTIINKLLPMVETSLSKPSILKLGTDVLNAGISNMEQERFPVDGYYKDGGQMINGIWYLPFDRDATIQHLHKYIFDDIKPTPKKSN